MNSFRPFILRSIAALIAVASLPVLLAVQAADEKPFGLERRVPWTSSRVVGSPDPPLPYTVERVFTNIQWKAPIYAVAEPGTESLLVVLQGGEADRPSKVLRVRDDPAASQAAALFEMNRRLIYSVTPHPGYATNGQLFVFSNGPTGDTERTNRVSRFTVERQPPHGCETSSERVIIEWRSAGHDGGEVVFGLDGMLYISTGDGTSDSDTWVSGQTLDDLLGGVLRIDVDHPEASRPYSVPRDNPFVNVPGARPENWAYGLRNPWRMTVDRKTGQIWAGNNGQDLWETAHLVRRGENYGWSVYEGNHPFYLHRQRGPTPHVPPTIEHHHSEFRSLTGGVVYYGEWLPELNGVYIYGDYSTGKIWGGRHDGTQLTWHRELADTALQIAGFAVGHRGDLFVVDHGGAIFRMIPAPPSSAAPSFPARLSETGLFVSVKDHQVQPGVIPYSVNAPAWADGAEAERFLAVPGEARIEYTTNRAWNFPEGTVLMQTLFMGASAGGESSSRRRIETRLFTRQQSQWAGYTYRWDESQADASLVDKQGADAEFTVSDRGAGGGGRKVKWHFPSRTECLGCHSRAVNFVLGLSELQMNREQLYGEIRDNQLRALNHAGFFTNALPKPPAELTRLIDPHDTSRDLEARARSYLHANCSACHVEAGGGNAKMELEFITARDRMNVFGARPQHDTFGLSDAMLIAPGDPDRSVLFQRISRRGRGQMPPLGTAVVDERAVRLFRDWISSMKVEQKFVRDWTMEDLLPGLNNLANGRSLEAGQRAFRDTGCAQCHRFNGEGGSVGPDLNGVAARLKPRDLLESIVLPSKTIAPEYATTEIETASGDILSGRVERENDGVVMLRQPGSADEPLTIRKADIKSRKLSAFSNMPAGMLNSLEKAQILDLLAYLMAGGKTQQASAAR